MALPRRSEKPDQFIEAQVVADAAHGSPDVLAALYARYARGLLAVAYRLLQSRQDAEDVVHDVALARRSRSRGARARDLGRHGRGYPGVRTNEADLPRSGAGS